MTSILALLAQSTGGTGPSFPPPTGVEPDPLPSLDDAFAVSLRPDGHRIATLLVGPAREFATLTAAISRSVALQNVALAAAGSTRPSPFSGLPLARMRDYRVDIIVDPGDYTDPIGVEIPHHVGIYAADGGHGTARFINAGISTTGWTHIEGCTFIPPKDGTGGKYALHHSSIGTTVFSRCHFDTDGRTAGQGGETPMGMDGGFDAGGEGFSLFYDHTFIGGTSTNMHGGNAGDANSDPDVIAYVRCAYPGILQYSNANASATSISQVWGVDSTAGSIEGYGYAQTHLSGNTLGTPSATMTDGRSDWPVPVGGLSPYWRTQLGL